VKRSFIREILESINEETISFAGGLPDETLFPIAQLKRAGDIVFTKPECLQYSLSNGIKPLRCKIAELYNKAGVPTVADNILVTTGSQQALYVISRYFSGEQIAIEEPSYLGAVNIFKMNGMQIHPMPLNHDGVDIDAFGTVFSKTKIAYLIPDFHNPRSSCYSGEKRVQVAEILKKMDGYIIEDGPYSELYFGDKQPSILSMAHERVMHLGSFSKTLSPAFRIGWVRADKEMIKQFTAIKETIDLHSCGISQHILNQYLEDDEAYIKHLAGLRRAYKGKMEFFADALRRGLPEFRFNMPEGGMFIYGRFDEIDTYDLVQKCMEEKVVFVPGNQFYLDGRNTSEIRFNFTKAEKDQVERGLNVIKKLIS